MHCFTADLSFNRMIARSADDFHRAQLVRTRHALLQSHPTLAPDHTVVSALAAVRPGPPPPGTPEAWRSLFDLPFTERRTELRRRLGYTFWTRELADAL